MRADRSTNRRAGIKMEVFELVWAYEGQLSFRPPSAAWIG